ncbi:MAG TPA: hypothetical protein VG502_15710 [Flexivirga sp.]|uniref:hypothetical protein n=1 Tax=Flexivirga sp. TaxID=1962927 RepID=UPI002CB23171|nr:hypothetical protein [Flexivirga sp.]HWC23740.1 hypothetical protein [Flexivirga sp.]
MHDASGRLRAQEILSSAELARRGVLPWEETRRAESRLARVRRGGYVVAERWSELDDENRYRGLVLSTFDSMLTDPRPMACLHSAAVLQGLPVLGRWPQHVDVLVGSGIGHTGLIRRHQSAHPPVPEHCDGIPVTPVPRTVVDLARMGALAHGLVTADAALHAGKCSLAELDNEIARLPPGARGRRRAALAIHLADGRSESPGESLSRARMYEFGLPQPDLQVELVDEAGVFGYADFGWRGLIGEFDGKVKYVSQEVLWKEKLREDRIRRTGPRVERWVWREAWQAEPLRQILSAAGLRPDAGGVWRRWDPARQPVRRWPPVEPHT